MVVIWALSVAAMDIAQRRIPNFLVGGAAFVCLFALAWIGQAPLGGEPWSVAGGLALALLLTLPGYLMRQLGAGDVKMLMAVATMGGYVLVVQTFVIGSLLAAGLVFFYWRFPREQAPARLPGKYLPFGAALAVGLIGSLLLLPAVHPR
ncbi:prepilin peptidase [Azonexus sp.]|uniref:prepilin peptidase n=1 Tax=Azonexus sp. TaxID=1872668 RepID=UPI0035AED0A7